MRLALLTMAVAALGAAAVVWLGGDGETPSPPEPAAPTPAVATAPAHSSWTASADAACAALLARFHAAMHPGDRSGVEVFEEAARLGHIDLAMFERLSPPPRERNAFEVVAAALAVQLIALEELAQAEDESNEARARIALDRARDARRRAHPFANQLGLAACAAEATRR